MLHAFMHALRTRLGLRRRRPVIVIDPLLLNFVRA